MRMRRSRYSRRGKLDIGMSSYVGGQISFALRRRVFDAPGMSDDLNDLYQEVMLVLALWAQLGEVKKRITV